ncbi:unnamed protein product, partial [Pylaiella littoralis]
PTLLPQRHHFSLPAAVPRCVFLVDWPTPPRLHRSMPLPSLSALGGGSDDTSTPLLDVVVLDGDDEQELYEQPPPGPSLGERHSVEGETISPLTAEQKAEAARCLRGTTMFKFCSDESILSIVEHMRREQFSEGEVLLEQGDPQSRVFLITQGSVSRLRYLNEQLHQVETVGGENH